MNRPLPLPKTQCFLNLLLAVSVHGTHISVAAVVSGHIKILFSVPQLESAAGGTSLLQKLKFNLCLIIKTPNNSFHV